MQTEPPVPSEATRETAKSPPGHGSDAVHGDVTGVVVQLSKDGVVAHGKPVAGATIEMCEDSKMTYDQKPCEAAHVVYSALTGVNGRFTLHDVQVGSYDVSFKIGEDWGALLGRDLCCKKLDPKKPLDIGKVPVTASH